MMLQIVEGNAMSELYQSSAAVAWYNYYPTDPGKVLKI